MEISWRDLKGQIRRIRALMLSAHGCVSRGPRAVSQSKKVIHHQMNSSNGERRTCCLLLSLCGLSLFCVISPVLCHHCTVTGKLHNKGGSEIHTVLGEGPH